MLFSIIQLYLISLVFNAFPAIAPPTSLLLSFYYIQTNINVFLLAIITVLGGMTGRTILYYVANKVGTKYFSSQVHEGYSVLRKIVHKNNFLTAFFMALYCLLPVSTGAVFMTAGAAKIRLWPLLWGYTMGRYVQYVTIAFTVSKAYNSLQDLLGNNLFNPASIGLSLIAIIIEIALLFLNWEELIQHKRLRFHKKLFK